MTNRIQVKETKGVYWDFEGSLVDIISKLQSALDEGWEGIDMEYEGYEGYQEYYFYKHRPETDKEYAKRMKLLEKEKAEKLLPDDHPYKIADEHGETNPYKQYLNSVENEKKMEELGFVKNSDGHWTARPLGETAQEEVKKLQEKDWDT